MEQDLTKRIDALEKWKASLEFSHSIPLNIDQSFRSRFGGELKASTHTGETKAVNEGGVATYSVMNVADGFVEKNLNGTIIYLPYFT